MYLVFMVVSQTGDSFLRDQALIGQRSTSMYAFSSEHVVFCVKHQTMNVEFDIN